MVIALTADDFSGVLGLVSTWFAWLVSPIAIPMLLGMLPAFKRCGPGAAISSWAVGLAVFVLTNFVFKSSLQDLAPDQVTAVSVGGPVVCALITFIVVGLVKPWSNTASDALVDSLGEDLDEESVARLAQERRAGHV